MTGSLPIDLQFKNIGRLHLRSHTNKKQVRDAMKQMLRLLHQTGHADVLRDLKAGRVKVIDVYERFRQGKLEQLPSGVLMNPIDTAWTKWLDEKEIAPKTRADYAKALQRLNAFGPGATLTHLPTLLQAHRTASRNIHPRTFNKDRSAALSFLSTLLGERHWLYTECWRVEQLKIPPGSKMAFNPQTIAEVRALSSKLAPHHAITLWGYYLTGMRPEEMFEEEENRWSLEPDRVRIEGGKSPASNRVVPRIGLLVKPSSSRRTFAKALAKATDGKVTPYDIRRSYAQLLDLARIPQFRQDYYMAHGPKNLNELYKRAKECQPHLLEDAVAIDLLVSEPMGLKVMK